MTIGIAIEATIGFILLSFVARYVLKHYPMWVYDLCGVALCVYGIILNVKYHDQFWLAINATGLLSFLNSFFKNKPPRMRKKAKKLVGAKARAVKEKLVRSMPTAKPVALPVSA